MKRLTLAMSIAATVLIFASESANAQRGRGQGSPAGPPPMSQRGQMPDRSSKPPKESHQPGSINREQPAKTASARLENDTHLSTRLQGLFPEGTDLQLASSGFKNLGQFVAAAHVSKNLGIPFDQLKLKMTGGDTTLNANGDSPVSLGKAIQQLRPEADASSEVKIAERQASEDIKHADTERKNAEKNAK